MTERKTPLIEEIDEPREKSLLDSMKANVRASEYHGLVGIVEQFDGQRDETKKFINAPGLSHVVTAIDLLDGLSDPDVAEVRIPSTTFQSTIIDSDDNAIPVAGNLDPDHAVVKQRLGHVYALLGAETTGVPSLDADAVFQEFPIATNLGPDIHAFTERGQNTIAIRVVRSKKD